VRAFIPPRATAQPACGIGGLYRHLDQANPVLGRLNGLTTLLPDTKFLRGLKALLLKTKITLSA